MTRIFSSSPYDTAEITALRARINEEDKDFTQTLRRFDERDRELLTRYNELLLAQRPEYPSPQHLQGLDLIAQFLRDGTKCGDHLGCQTPADEAAGRALPPGIRFCSTVRRVNFYALAPYKPNCASRFWQFTDHEVDELHHQMRERGLKPVQRWSHDDGIGFFLARP